MALSLYGMSVAFSCPTRLLNAGQGPHAAGSAPPETARCQQHMLLHVVQGLQPFSFAEAEFAGIPAVHDFGQDGFITDRATFKKKIVPRCIQGYGHFATIRIPTPHQFYHLLDGGALSYRPGAFIFLAVLAGL